MSGGRRHEREESHISEPRINDRIRVAEVRLVGPEGEQVGIVRVEDALRLAQDADLDLVEVAPDARPPVCKIMDYGKFKYEADMKAREARRNQTNTVLKEIRFRLKIDPHDYGTKKGHVERFLKAGDKVKVMIMFRGREQSRPEMGIRLLQRLADDVAELGFVESAPKQDGRNMIMVIGPVKKKADQKSEQRRAASRTEQPAAAQQPTAGQSPTAPEAPVAPEQVSSPAPVVDAPATEAPAMEVPATEAPAVVAPVVEAAVADVPVAAPEAVAPAPAAPAPRPVAAPKPPTPRAPAAKAPAPRTPAPRAPRPATPQAPAPKPGTDQN
ncbi:translation initiation factor IF-3 [Cellulomonas sp. P24]|uniref:translation initiation factor IF-3 n=1 Tax=Cellulomonas sp. P24 TaxID=2885206 RepID=UPI0028704EC2|nr:translation initiation factor IF-3 [Cellulomonas sp. P24]